MFFFSTDNRSLIEIKRLLIVIFKVIPLRKKKNKGNVITLLYYLKSLILFNNIGRYQPTYQIMNN